MPRTASYTSDQLVERALNLFWTSGYNATSMDALVAATGVSRHGIYKGYADKHALFLACFAKYQETVVSPAFCGVEDPGADLDAIARYFETQITAAEAAGLPGPGCFVANAATEVAPHDRATAALVSAHNDRLRRGFRNALRNVAPPSMADQTLDDLAETCVVFAGGLWAMSRATPDADPLRRAVHAFLGSLKGAVQP
ncbi:MAG: TetR/AcrR family transcriptional regulator [Pseudomonadota bacterium]